MKEVSREKKISVRFGLVCDRVCWVWVRDWGWDGFGLGARGLGPVPLVRGLGPLLRRMMEEISVHFGGHDVVGFSCQKFRSSWSGGQSRGQTLGGHCSALRHCLLCVLIPKPLALSPTPEPTPPPHPRALVASPAHFNPDLRPLRGLLQAPPSLSLPSSFDYASAGPPDTITART